MAAVSIPVMAKVRIGHTVEAQILQAVGVDYIDVSLHSDTSSMSPYLHMTSHLFRRTEPLEPRRVGE